MAKVFTLSAKNTSSAKMNSFSFWANLTTASIFSRVSTFLNRRFQNYDGHFDNNNWRTGHVGSNWWDWEGQWMVFTWPVGFPGLIITMALTLHLQHLLEGGWRIVSLPRFCLLYTSLQLLHIERPIPRLVQIVSNLEIWVLVKSCFGDAIQNWICNNVCAEGLKERLVRSLPEKMPADLLHVVLCKAGAVEGVLGDGDHHPRPPRAGALGVCHQLHNCANTLAGSCKSLLHSVKKMKRKHIWANLASKPW